MGYIVRWPGEPDVLRAVPRPVSSPRMALRRRGAGPGEPYVQVQWSNFIPLSVMLKKTLSIILGRFFRGVHHVAVNKFDK